MPPPPGDIAPPTTAQGVDIDDLHVERGHRTLTVVRKGGKIVVTLPLAPRVARAMDLAIGDRAGGAGVPVRRRGPGQAQPPRPRITTMRYDRGRQSPDRHTAHIVATFVAGASR